MEIRVGSKVTIRKTRKTYNELGHVHELTFTCFHRLPLLAPESAKSIFISGLDQARRKHDFEVHAYVLMPEHVHLLINPKQYPYSISTILHSIKTKSSRLILNSLERSDPSMIEKLLVSRQNGRQEHRVWQQGGGYDRNLTSPEAIANAIAYIHRNPHRRNLEIPEADWLWSSEGVYVGRHPEGLVTMYRA